MTLAEAAELYRVLTDVKREVMGLNGYGVREGDSGEVRGKSGESVSAWRIDGGVIKVEMVNGETLEIKDLEQLERLMGELMSQITDYKRLGADYNVQKAYRVLSPTSSGWRTIGSWRRIPKTILR